MSDTAGMVLVYAVSIYLGMSSLVGAGTIVARIWSGALSDPLILILGIIGGIIGAGIAWGLYNA